MVSVWGGRPEAVGWEALGFAEIGVWPRGWGGFVGWLPSNPIPLLRDLVFQEGKGLAQGLMANKAGFESGSL